MKSGSLFLVFILFLSVETLQSQETRMYRLHLKDKGNPPFTPANSGDFLSQKSIERRMRQGLPVDYIDLPLDPAYLDEILNTGATIRTYSKWVNTVVVQLADLQILSILENLSFVDTLYCVWKGTLPVKTGVFTNITPEPEIRQNTINSYGAGFTQIALNNGHLLHNAGFRGKGKSIAVLDAGFINAGKVYFFNQERIKEVKNFNHEVSDILRTGSNHGTRVLSCMLSDRPGEMTGTAPEADYYLFRTEVSYEEYPVEEDYWIAGLEYADSIGVDIVTSSLGYTTFDSFEMNHKHGQLDGKTIPFSKAANLAASRGILLFNSAGNEGANIWRKISFPSDAENIITVGSTTEYAIRSTFSSHGFTADKRIKPDLMAMGSAASVVDYDNKIVQSNGTSFSTPILAGLAACLWEALPELNSFEMLQLLRENGSQFENPDSLMGYGIADVYKAYSGQLTGSRRESVSSDPFYFSINPSNNLLFINLINPEQYNLSTLEIYNTLGNRVLTVANPSAPIDISFLPKGIYITHLRIGDKQLVRKFVKT